jgi:hypothetical protein
MICCVSDSDFGKVLDPVPDPDNTVFSTVFHNTKKLHKILPFNVRSSFFFQKVGLSFILDFLTLLIHFMLDPESEP